GRKCRLDWATRGGFFGGRFRGLPEPDEWLAFIARLAAMHRHTPLDLVVIDPLAAFYSGKDENNARMMLQALVPLRLLLGLGIAVLVLHHPRKGETLPGQAFRGTGALGGHVDILIEMFRASRTNRTDRRRRLVTDSRPDQSPLDQVIELTADGTEYLDRGPALEEEFLHSWRILESVLEKATGKMTRREILQSWPPDRELPGDVTLWRWLERAV